MEIFKDGSLIIWDEGELERAEKELDPEQVTSLSTKALLAFQLRMIGFVIQICLASRLSLRGFFRTRDLNGVMIY